MNNSPAIALDYGLIFLITRITFMGLLLVIFGIWFNTRFERDHREGLTEPFVWAYVIVGTLVTIFAVAVFMWDWFHFVVTFFAFACSGMPMAYGDIQRYWQKLRGWKQRLEVGEPTTPRTSK